MLKDISGQLDGLYHAYQTGEGIGIYTGMHISGEPVNFLFIMEDDKFSRISTTKNFSEWMANCTGDWKAACPTITKLAKLYSAQWDNENGILYIRFRRNQMSVGSAIMRLQQAVAVICALGPV